MIFSHSDFKIIHRRQGFSLLELVVVVSVIGILFSLAAGRYQNHIRKSQATMVSFQAATFLRSVENIRAISTLQNSSTVDMGEGLEVYLNRSGWPVATNASGLKKQRSLSKLGCESLWLGLFTDVDKNKWNNSKSPNKNLEITLIDEYICRYMLVRKQEGSFFFDYDVITGTVVITAEET